MSASVAVGDIGGVGGKMAISGMMNCVRERMLAVVVSPRRTAMQFIARIKLAAPRFESVLTLYRRPKVTFLWKCVARMMDISAHFRKARGDSGSQSCHCETSSMRTPTFETISEEMPLQCTISL
jgi:hypothetical protein